MTREDELRSIYVSEEERESKDAQRREIADQVAHYLASGGTITRLDPGETGIHYRGFAAFSL